MEKYCRITLTTSCGFPIGGRRRTQAKGVPDDLAEGENEEHREGVEPGFDRGGSWAVAVEEKKDAEES